MSLYLSRILFKYVITLHYPESSEAKLEWWNDTKQAAREEGETKIPITYALHTQMGRPGSLHQIGTKLPTRLLKYSCPTKQRGRLSELGEQRSRLRGWNLNLMDLD